MYSFNKIRYTIGLVVLLILFIGVFIVQRETQGYKTLVGGTRGNLNRLRDEIKYFNDHKSRYPESLAEMRFVAERESLEITAEKLKEYFTGSTKEVNKLDGSGGWFYNKITGEVRVNLTKPLKVYCPLVIINRNEPPSSW